MPHAKISYWFPLAIVFFEIFTYLANDMYLPGLPMLMAEFGISQHLAQDTLLYWFLGSASMQLLMGPLSDRYGRKIVLIFGVLCFTGASYICANTASIFIFLICRFIQGCSVSSVVVAGYAAVHETFETKIAIKIIALMGSVVILAPAFGPILGALVIEFSNWRMIFNILSLGGVTSLLLLVFAMPGLQKENYPLHLREIFKDYWRIGTRKAFLTFALPFCFMFLSLICWVVESPFILVEHYHQSTIAYGLIQLYVFGFFIIGAQITGFAVNRVSPIMLIKIGLLVALVASTGFVLACLSTSPLYVMIICMMFVALGLAMTFGPLSRFAIEACTEPMGRRMAIFSSYMSIFGVFSTLLVTFVKTDSMQYLAWMVYAGIICSSFIFCLGKVKNNIGAKQ